MKTFKNKARKNIKQYSWLKLLAEVGNAHIFNTTQGNRFAVVRTNSGWDIVEIKE